MNWSLKCILCLSVLVQLLNHVQLFVTSWIAARQASLSITNSWSLFKLMSILSVMPSNHLTLCCPLLLLPSIFPSMRVFSNESALWIRWPKYWSFSFSISPSNEYLGLIFFRTDWFDLAAVQMTLKNLPTTIWKHQFFSAQPFLWPNSHILTWLLEKPLALTRWTFVSKEMSLLFNMLFRLVIAFLPRSKSLLISWLQSPSAVILEPKKIKSLTVSIVSPSVCHEVLGPDGISLWVLSQLFHSSLSLSSRGSLDSFTFCHKGGVICISEVIDISPGSLDSSLCFIQFGISHDVLCI